MRKDGYAIVLALVFVCVGLGCQESRQTEGSSRQSGRPQQSSPAKNPSEVIVGTPKNEILARLGTPQKWVKVKIPNKETVIVTVFSLAAAEGAMPNNEIWLFEYTTMSGVKFAVHCRNGTVEAVVDGPILRE